MNLLHIEPYLQTPEVDFNPDNGDMLLIGKSYPADAVEFYQPIIEWVRKYVQSPAAKNTKLLCEIEYLNSASQKQVVDLIMSFKPLLDKKYDFVVEWRYEEGDDDILSVGELIEHELGIPFLYEEF